MPRPSKQEDAFAAIAEPRRRQLITLLIDGDAHAVNDLVAKLALPQPAVSKHLSVLRKAGLVTMTKDGQRRLYRLAPKELKPVHDWIRAFEQFWTHQLDSIRDRAERVAAQRSLAAQALRPPDTLPAEETKTDPKQEK